MRKEIQACTKDSVLHILSRKKESEKAELEKEARFSINKTVIKKADVVKETNRVVQSDIKKIDNVVKSTKK
jgi:hypothetical protein